MTQPIVNLQDHEHAAQAALGAAAWAYFSGGAADEITLRHNVAAWQNLRLLPRVLQDLRGGHTSGRLLGREWPMPLLVAPMAYQRWAHPEGESGMALAAAAQGCSMVLSHQTSTPLHAFARRGGAGGLRCRTRPLVVSALRAGRSGCPARLVGTG